MHRSRFIPGVLVLGLVIVLGLANLAPAAPAPQGRGGRGPQPTPDRAADQGVGPFGTMAIRGVMLIDGTGGPPRGPVNVIVEGNRIARVGGNIPPDVDYVVEADGKYLCRLERVTIGFENTDEQLRALRATKESFTHLERFDICCKSVWSTAEDIVGDFVAPPRRRFD